MHNSVEAQESGAIGDEGEHDSEGCDVEETVLQQGLFVEQGAVSVLYSLRVDGTVRIAVYDLLGRQVKTLVDRSATAGSHIASWDGTEDSGRAAASGIYFYRLESDGAAMSRKLLLIK